MSARLILVSLDWLRPKDPRTTLGHASLLARLVAAGIDALSITRPVNVPHFDRAELLGAILAGTDANSDVAIGAYVWNEDVVQWLLPALRGAGFSGRIILGGPQITYAPAGVLDLYPDADVIIRGYGEDALVAVMRAREPAILEGVTWRGQRDSGLPATVNLAGLPSPILSGTLPVQAFMRWETQRGCIYSCSFCQHRESGSRLRQRVMLDERVMDEIDALVAGGAQDIAVLDPIFHTNTAALEILGRFSQRGYTGRLSLQSRFESVDDAFLDACAGLNVRLEFGLQTTERSEMAAVQRINDLRKVEAVIEKLHTREIPFEVTLIYGLPTQTLASFERSVRWCQDRGVEVLKAFPLMLLRGTGLDRDRARWELIESDDAIPVVVQSSTFSREEWAQMHTIAEGLEDGRPIVPDVPAGPRRLPAVGPAWRPVADPPRYILVPE